MSLRTNKNILLFFLFLFIPSLTLSQYVKGIYITQSMCENNKKMKNFIKRAKETGINTFVIDLGYLNKRYDKNIELVKDSGIKYVARIVVFPDGGTRSQVTSKAYWDKKYRLIDHAVKLGAKEIQLDYIRYNTKQKQIAANAHDIHKVIKYYKSKLEDKGVKLQIDVFGETCYKPSLAIGQDIKLFAGTIDALNPMVYPSHWHPPAYHSERPYQTIAESLAACYEQLGNDQTLKIYPYIEVNNYRYRYGAQKHMQYIYKQIKAVQDSDADGWYAWSPKNRYYYLFRVLETYPVK